MSRAVGEADLFGECLLGQVHAPLPDPDGRDGQYLVHGVGIRWTHSVASAKRQVGCHVAQVYATATARAAGAARAASATALTAADREAAMRGAAWRVAFRADAGPAADVGTARAPASAARPGVLDTNSSRCDHPSGNGSLGERWRQRDREKDTERRITASGISQHRYRFHKSTK